MEQDKNLNSLLRALPAVDILALYIKNNTSPALKGVGEAVILASCKRVIESLRQDVLSGKTTKIPPLSKIADLVADKAKKESSYSLKKVINATGVVLHTNLGRAVLAKKAAEHVKEIAMSYSTLEYSVQSGERGSRHSHVEQLICNLTGAEAAMVVNNNAAAVMLALSSICGKKKPLSQGECCNKLASDIFSTECNEVIVSRGELVEIGGSFRIPEIMQLSGAVLREVGTTNKTKLSDYQNAINSQKTAALLKVHTSNFKIVGFTQNVQICQLSSLAKAHNIPLIYDLGSGFMLNNLKLQQEIGENSVIDGINGGADIVCFSGDKLFGSSQAGIIAGRKKYIESMKKNQLARVVRIDKLSLAALEATLKIYSDPSLALSQIPTLANIFASEEALKKKAERLLNMLKKQNGFKESYLASVKKSMAQVGGGSAPGENLASYVIEILPKSMSATDLECNLRGQDTPIIARINKGNVLLDVRTIDEDDFKIVCHAF